MKLRKGLYLRNIDCCDFVVPDSQANVFMSNLLKLNSTGVFLWKLLEEGANEETLAENLQRKYGIAQQQADNDTQLFLQKLNEAGCLEQDS